MNDTMDWEDRFEEKFPPFRGIGARFPIFDTTPNRNHIIQFIRSLLASKQAEMEREIDSLIFRSDFPADEKTINAAKSIIKKIMEQ